MTIFDFISNILFTKKQKFLDNIDSASEFSPFILNRWISMYSPEIVPLCNAINRYLGVFENKTELYSLFFSVFNKQPSKKINYFKKNKEQKQENNDLDLYKKIANSKELSFREIKEYVELYKDIAKS